MYTQSQKLGAWSRPVHLPYCERHIHLIKREKGDKEVSEGQVDLFAISNFLLALSKDLIMRDNKGQLTSFMFVPHKPSNSLV